MQWNLKGLVVSHSWGAYFKLVALLVITRVVEIAIVVDFDVIDFGQHSFL